MPEILFWPQFAYAGEENTIDATYQHLLSISPDLLSILIGPLLVAILPIALSFFLNWKTGRKIKRFEYSDSRSEYVTRSRFDKEIDCIQDLSMNLLVLIQDTKRIVQLVKTKEAEAIEENETTVISEVAREWELQHEEVVRSIGKAAPFLNYLDLHNSSIPYCGVSRKEGASSCEEGASEKESNDGKKTLIEKSCICASKTEAEGGEKYKCPACREHAANLALIGIQSSLDGSMYIEYLKGSIADIAKTESEKVGKNLYHRACEILLLCEYAKQEKDLGCVRPAGSCSGNAGSPHEYRTYLDCRYARFINCAYCRLNAIEYGRESWRKKNKEEGDKLKNWRARKREEKMKKYDQRCPYR